MRRMLLSVGLTMGLITTSQAQMAAPQAEHELLAQLAGEWEGTTTLHVPGMEPVSSPASTTARLALGGFWLIGEFKGSMMGVDFEGHSVLGFDPGKGKYVETWVSNLLPEVTVLEGDYDATTQTWSKYRDDAKDMFSGAPVRERHQLKMTGPDSYVVTIAQKAEGGEFQVLLEMEQHRK